MSYLQRRVKTKIINSNYTISDFDERIEVDATNNNVTITYDINNSNIQKFINIRFLEIVQE